MLRPLLGSLLSWLTLLTTFNSASVSFAADLTDRVVAAAAYFEGAEDRFRPPNPAWFESTRTALEQETLRVEEKLDAQGEAYAAAWKNHLRWHLLTRNLGQPSEIEFSELALVRRWLYSNRKGLEYPFFAELRTNADDHLAAAYTFTHPNLEAAFKKQVQVARRQIWNLAADPSDARAAELGRTLGWFQKTRQLPEETAAVRSLLSFPNAQVLISKSLIDRIVGLLATEVEQTLPVSDRVTVPNASLLGRPRTAQVHGIAHSHGKINLELAADSDLAKLQLVYLGEIDSRCRAVVGPVKIAMQTLGPVEAITPVELSLAGVRLLSTEVVPQVQTKITNVSAKRAFIRRIGERRVHEPDSLQQMNSRARMKAVSLLQSEMDERVGQVIDEIRTEIEKAQGKLNGFRDVLAPVAREGASPHLLRISSTPTGVTVDALSQRTEQFGSPLPCPRSDSADLQVRLHVSFINNMMETIMAGKTFTDKYFMNYSKILQAEMPPQLMVHARSTPWAIVAAKPRPLEITIPAPNRFKIQLKMQRVVLGDEEFTGPTVATIKYELQQNEFDEYQMRRLGDVQIDSPMPAEMQAFLWQKFDAFFAPVLDAGGVALPEGGTLGGLRGLQSQGVVADDDWLTLGVQVPTEVIQQLLPMSLQQ